MTTSRPRTAPFRASEQLARRTTEHGLVVADNALGLIGGTPMVRLRGIAAGGATVWAKVESCNPAGSVKDRPAVSMVLAAEADGILGPGSTLLEATSGNTGISLAMIAAVRGYRCVLVMPEDMSVERRRVLRAFGAETELTSPQEGMAGAVRRAMELLDQISDAFMPSQFDNVANPWIHEHQTAEEILEQTGGHIDAFVAGVGTGGTLTGVAKTLRARLGPAVKVVAVEPADSAVLGGGSPGMHGIPGLGAGFVPGVLDRKLIDDVIAVSDSAAQRMAARLAQEHGLLVGPSSGANVHAAGEVAMRLGGGTVVTLLCDLGERYLI